MIDRDLLRAAARDLRRMMQRRQANETAAMIATGDAWGWVEPDPTLWALAAECDDVVYSKRIQPPDLHDRLAQALGDDWEP